MKYVIVFSIILLSFKGFGQASKFYGEYEGSQSSQKRGIVSRFTLSKDSFVLVYAFAPLNYINKVNGTESPAAAVTVDLGQKKELTWYPEGSALKVFKGTWRIENSRPFNTEGWDFLSMDMPDSDPFTVSCKPLHLTSKDGDRVIFKYNDGNTTTGLLSERTLSSQAIFFDNLLSEVFLLKK